MPTLDFPEPTAEILAYHQGNNLLWITYRLVAIGVPLLFLYLGLARQASDWATKRSSRGTLQLALVILLYLLFSWSIRFPLDLYAGYFREQAYGLSQETMAHWLGQHVKSFGLILLVLLSFLSFPYWLFRRGTRQWWLVLSPFVFAYFLISLWLSPILIEPLMDKMAPMAAGPLKEQILQTARRAGLSTNDVFVVEKSDETKTVNAYVTGVGSTHRIVLWDTLIRNFSEPEVLSVIGHEVGHYRLKHVMVGVLLYAGLTCFIAFLINLVAPTLLRRFRSRWKIETLADPASFPLLLSLGYFFYFLASPIAMVYSRHVEHEADRFSLELLQDSMAFVTSEIKLAEINKSLPRPPSWIVMLRYSHPSPGERLDFGMSYRPWETGGTLRYEKYFIVDKSR